MLKIIGISDLHLRLNDPLGSYTSDGLSTRIHQKKNILDEVYNYIQKYKPDYIVDFGDTYNAINPPEKLRIFYAETIRRFDIPTIRILGNHETDGVYGVGFDVQIFGSERIQIINTPTVLKLRGERILFIPEVSNEKIIAALEANPDIPCLGHFGVVGSKFSSGKISETGIPIEVMSNRTAPTYLGHFHARQKLPNGVTFVGAIAKDNFGDRDINPGAVLLDVSRSSVIETYLPVNDIDLINIVVTQDAPDISEMHFKKDAVVKLTYEGSRDWFDTTQDAKKIKTELYAKGAAKVFVKFIPVIAKVDNIDLDVDSFNFEEIVRNKAEKDKQDPYHGLEFLKAAVEVDEND